MRKVLNSKLTSAVIEDEMFRIGRKARKRLEILLQNDYKFSNTPGAFQWRIYVNYFAFLIWKYLHFIFVLSLFILVHLSLSLFAFRPNYEVGKYTLMKEKSLRVNNHTMIAYVYVWMSISVFVSVVSVWLAINDYDGLLFIHFCFP